MNGSDRIVVTVIFINTLITLVELASEKEGL
jgi:hypothetical protein